MDMFANTAFPELAKMLDVLSERHRVIANNVANVNTPGYRSQDVAFQSVLRQISQFKQNAESAEQFTQQLADVRPEKIFNGAGFDNQGINDVDMDREMVNLAANTLLFKTYAQMMLMQLTQLKTAINERV
ncbi:MAG: flagellar basal body rod protein FlgB [Candidatus Omnitrophica bacterium]|nr:flagellar basal body rod protein FlgB [Candidatus Omnitrophota bacterium]